MSEAAPKLQTIARVRVSGNSLTHSLALSRFVLVFAGTSATAMFLGILMSSTMANVDEVRANTFGRKNAQRFLQACRSEAVNLVSMCTENFKLDAKVKR